MFLSVALPIRSSACLSLVLSLVPETAPDVLHTSVPSERSGTDGAFDRGGALSLERRPTERDKDDCRARRERKNAGTRQPSGKLAVG